MMDYTATYPTSTTVDERVKEFISAFYAISDDPSRDNEWVDCFTPDAFIALGDRQAKGTEEIREFRKGMGERVKSQTHKVEKVFPAAFESSEPEPKWRFEYMLHGSVDIELKSAGKATGQWAARAILVDHEGRLKYKFYQVYLHTQPV
ncbi:hypothetical protein F4825DRAFT_412429 [Nemania diffusa]|nr:hypothetical protein F4825DRAFT_412429 [Nemania diffusa]